MAERRGGRVRGATKLNIAHGDPVDLTVVSAGTAAAEVPATGPQKMPGIPEELSDLWDEVVPGLDAAGLLAPSDGAAVEAMLMHFDVMRKAYKELMEDSIAVEDTNHGGGLKKNPADVVLRNHSDHFSRYAQQLGMTFIARARTPLQKKEGSGGEPNPFAAAG